jgi:hypothetical protein
MGQSVNNSSGFTFNPPPYGLGYSASTSPTRLHNILQGFVDINLEYNPNSFWKNLNVPSCNFSSGFYLTQEGQTLTISVSLPFPSRFGIEEVDIKPVGFTAGPDDFTVAQGLNFPIRLFWNKGEITQTINLDITNDLTPESYETLGLYLDNFINCKPGNTVFANIGIIDNTGLPEVKILTNNGTVLNLFGNQFLLFRPTEGQMLPVTVALDSPSAQGLETVNLSFINGTASNNDYSTSIGDSLLSFAVGEQYKVVDFSALSDNNIEPTETVTMRLTNSLFCNIGTFSAATFFIKDNSPDTYFVRLDLSNLYVQRGVPTSVHTDLRWTANNSEGENNWFVKFGEYLNDPGGTQTSTTNQILSGIDLNTFFGLDPAGNPAGDVRLKITNQGPFSIKYNGVQYSPGQSLSLVVDSNNYTVDLPCNTGLVPIGNGFTAQTVTQALYNIELEVDYDAYNFTLRGADNFPSPNNTILLCGGGLFNGVQLISQAQPYKLFTSYNNINSGVYNPFYNTTSCPVGGNSTTSVFGNTPESGIIIDGIALLDSNGSTSYNAIYWSQLPLNPLTCQTVQGSDANFGDWKSFNFKKI